MKSLLNRYNYNKLLWLGVVSSIFATYYFLLTASSSLLFQVLAYLFLILAYYYNLNLLHIASHQGLSKAPWLNNLLGSFTALISGFSFQVFTQIHILHHRHFGDDQLDPDHQITKDGRFYFIPFRVWYQDFYFWKSGVGQKNYRWLQVVSTRIIQLGFLIWVMFSPYAWFFLIFWLSIMLIEGYLFSMFQFFFPHYVDYDHALDQTPFENLWLWTLALCRQYHDAHHLRVVSNRNYFPLENWLLEKLLDKKTS